VFGKRYRSKKVDLTCPCCGHIQQEPALVISTFCRSCGEHFRVRKGVAFINPGLRVSGLAELVPTRRQRLPLSGLKEESSPYPPSEPAPHHASEETELTAGAFFGLSADEPYPETGETSGGSLGRDAQSREALAEGSLGALIAARQTVVVAGKEKMPPNYAAPDDRRRREDNVPGVPVRCFRCHHHQDVSRFAKSTQCERCSTYISLAHYEIKTVKSHTLRTRGDIVIAKKGGLIHNSEIACHHLTVSGSIDAIVDCSGDAVFRHSGRVRGQLHCETLVLEKNCQVSFPDGVMAKRAEIAGHLVGDLTCSGKVRVARNGIIEGSLAAIDLELRDGGRISGETRLDPGITTEPTLSRGFNPNLIG